jgi:hypothetical protein
MTAGSAISTATAKARGGLGNHSGVEIAEQDGIAVTGSPSLVGPAAVQLFR